jgi:hypothetical protein
MKPKRVISPKSGIGKGRPKGVPNKVTRDVREAFRTLIENNADNFEKWLKRVAKGQPAKALQLVTQMSEFCIPKLQRTEHQGLPPGMAELAEQAAAALAKATDSNESAVIYRELMFGATVKTGANGEPVVVAPSTNTEQ